MEIVIKISENVYKALAHTEFDANLVVNEMRKSIANGTPLPKQGHWEQIYIPLPLSDSGKDCYCCSECLTHWDYPSNYCPNCGAKMISASKDVK